MRPLSAYAAVIASRAEHDIYYAFCVAADYTTPLSRDAILATLAVLCRRFPHFSLQVDTSTVPPRCTCMPKWDLAKQPGLVDVFSGADDDVTHPNTVEAILKHYNDVPVFRYADKDTPLWKVALLEKTNTLFFVTDHVYFDGTAAKNFHVLFDEALTQTRQPGAERSLLVDTSVFDTYPDPTVLMNFDPAAKPAPASTPDAPTLFPVLDEKIAAAQPLPAHNSTIVHLSAKDSQALVNRARANNTKLTALLYAVAAKSVVPLVDKAAVAASGAKLKAMIPINTRPLVTSLPQNSDVLQFGLMFGKYFAIEDPATVVQSTLEELSASFQSRLQANIPHAADGYEVFEADARKNFQLVDESMASLYERNLSPKTTLAMSNLGVLKSASGHVGKVYFDQPMVDACFGVHFCSSSEAGLSITLNSHRAVPKDVYLQFVNSFTSYIASLVL